MSFASPAVKWLKAIAIFAAISVAQSDAQEDLTQWVDPLIGTAGALLNSSDASGNVFPGAAVPFGVVKAGIDTNVADLPQDTGANGGFSPLGNVTAISLMHESGTGGEPKYGVVSQMPLVGDLQAKEVNVANNRTYQTPRASDIARAGHWTTKLTNGIQFDITASAHAAIIQYSFPITEDNRYVLIDLGHVLPSSDSSVFTQSYLGGNLSIDTTKLVSYSGFADYQHGWNRGGPWRIHFCGNFDIPFSAVSSGTFQYPYDPFQLTSPPPTTLIPLNTSNSISASPNSGVGIGVLLAWPGQNISKLESRIAISFISAERACQFLDEEVPRATSFTDTVNSAKRLWNEQVLSSVIVPGGSSRNTTLLRMLYTGLYFTGLMPSNRTGENPNWKSPEPSYDDYYTMWDIFRCLTPWYNLVQTPRYIEMLRSVIDIFVHDGYTPDGRSSNTNGLTQGGSNSDVVLGDAFVRGLDKAPSIDWGLAWQAMVKDAEVQPPTNQDNVSFDGGNLFGRGGLDDWINVGWVTRNHSRSISRSVEYAQNDFALYQVAKSRFGANSTEAIKYLGRAQQWENLWNANFSSDLPDSIPNFKGFLVPRNADGSFNLTGVTGIAMYNATNCGECEWNSDTYEAVPFEYSFNIPHDIANLIEKMGGSQEFIRRLDTMFIQGLSSGGGSSNTAGTALFNPGNEPSFLTPFLYNYVPGSQFRTVNHTRATIDRFYNDRTNGIPGNSDAGAMQSWMIWNFIGLFPVAGQGIYLVHAPRFKSVDVRLLTTQAVNPNASPATLKIRAPKYSEINFWPQSIKFNGKPLNRTYLFHSEIENGATLEWDLGPEPSQWDKNFTPPPSISTGRL